MGTAEWRRANMTNWHLFQTIPKTFPNNSPWKVFENSEEIWNTVHKASPSDISCPPFVSSPFVVEAFPQKLMRVIVALSVVTLWVELGVFSPPCTIITIPIIKRLTMVMVEKRMRMTPKTLLLCPSTAVIQTLAAWLFSVPVNLSRFLFKPVCIHLASQDIIMIIMMILPPSSLSPWPSSSSTSSSQARSACKLCYRCCPSFVSPKHPFAVHGGHCVRAWMLRLITFCLWCTSDQTFWCTFLLLVHMWWSIWCTICDLITFSSKVYMWSDHMVHMLCFHHIFTTGKCAIVPFDAHAIWLHLPANLCTCDVPRK